MKTTEWKEYTEGGRRYRIRATYGVDYDFGRRNSQQPHFSVTGEIEYQDGRRQWKWQSGGMLHDEIEKHFPQLAPYLKWHLVSLGEPMHYIANAKYWFEKAMGMVTPGTRPASPGEPVPMTAFLSTVIFGGIPGEKMPYTNDWQDVEKWLRSRLPKLMGHFTAEMQQLGVLE